MRKHWLATNWHRALAHTVCLLALLWMGLDFVLHLEDYNANRALMLRSGQVGLIALVASFACTPISRWRRQPRALQIRRALGLYGFLFVVIHLGVYAWLDSDFDLMLIIRDLDERRAMSIGLIAFGLLVPLAITSTKGWQRRLGKGWRILHRLAYLVLPLSVWHYLWLDRDFVTIPLGYAVVVALLLFMRLSRSSVKSPL